MLGFIRNVEQLKILDAADEACAIVRSPGYVEHVPRYAAVRFDVLGWADKLDAAAREGRRLYTLRGAADDRFENESREVRDLVEDFAKWLRKLHLAAYAIERLDHPLARSVRKLFKVGDFDTDSAESVYGDGPLLLSQVLDLGDLSEVGLPPAFVDQARQLLDRIGPDRTDAWSERTVRVNRTTQLHRVLDRIVDLMETCGRYREFASVMDDGDEIPEFGLGNVRAALASQPKQAEPGQLLI